MRLVYVDEAGISNPKHEPYLVVAGVIVDADKKLRQLESELDKIVAHRVPAKYQTGFILHATELFNGGKQIQRDDPAWPFSLRMDIAADLAKLPRKLQLPIAFGWIKRDEFENPSGHNDPREVAKDIHMAAFMRCAVQVDLWVRKNTKNEICVMVVEDNQESRTLIRGAQSYYQSKKIPDLTEQERKVLPLRTIKEDPLFQTKRPSSALQLADFCAYIFKRCLMKPGDAKMKPFFEAMARQLFYYRALPES